MPKPSPPAEHTANWSPLDPPTPDPPTPDLPGARLWADPASNAGCADPRNGQPTSWTVPGAPPAGPPRSSRRREHAPGRWWPRHLINAPTLGEVDDRSGRARAHLRIAQRSINAVEPAGAAASRPAGGPSGTT